MKQIFTRPLTTDDVRWLDATRRAYWHADLELPHDFTAPGVMTVGLHEAHRLFGSLTGTKAVVLDPFIHDASYDEKQGAKLIYGLVKADAILTHWGQQGGAVDSYIAIPNQLSSYSRLLTKYGYSVTCQNCTILRRALTPETVPLLGLERDGQRPPDDGKRGKETGTSDEGDIYNSMEKTEILCNGCGRTKLFCTCQTADTFACH